MRGNLIAYIPVLNQRHLDWFKKYPKSKLYLISQKLAEALVPRLKRNIGALSSEDIAVSIRALDVVGSVRFLTPSDVWVPPDYYILADEDVCHVFTEKFLLPRFSQGLFRFEEIWARWDMIAVKRISPVMDGVESTTDHEHQFHIEFSKRIASKSSDWFRQVGASVVIGRTVVRAHNAHFPTEYSPDIMGDPRINVDAGQIGKYTSFHAEKTAIIQCAAEGISTRRASLYTTVFPCEDCARAIVVAEIKEVFFEEGYSALDAKEVLRKAGVKIFQVLKDPESA